MWETNKGTIKCDKSTVTYDVDIAQCEDGTITYDVGTIQYKDESIKCERIRNLRNVTKV